MKPSAGGGSAVDKTLAVLCALGQHERIADISVATGLPKSTVHRILQSLVRHDFAHVTDVGTYLGGPRILTLAGRMMSRLDPARMVDEELRALQDETACTVHLALLSGDEVHYVAKVESLKPYRMASRVGMRVRLHSTAIGKAILAAMPDRAARALLNRTAMEPCTARTITDGDIFVRHLQEIRQRGYAVDDEENEDGVRCVAASVTDHTASVTGALSVSFLVSDREQLPVPELGQRVADAASAVSARLGAQVAAGRNRT